MSTNLTMEKNLYGLFAQGERYDELMKKMPSRLKGFCQDNPKAKEQVVAVDRVGLQLLLSLHGSSLRSDAHIKVFQQDRGLQEDFGPLYQLIGAACLHAGDKLLLLKLQAAPDNVDGYRAGTLTYPQGHVQFDRSLSQGCIGDNEYAIGLLMDKVRSETFREISEEIGHEDHFTHLKLMEDIRTRLFRANAMRDVYPIYLDVAGSAGRHICMLFDVDMTGTSFETVCDEIVSMEPKKHEVAIVTYQDLLQLDRIDLICSWVARSFSKVPYLGTTFIKKYLAPVI
jgi:hypothetical protein